MQASCPPRQPGSVALTADRGDRRRGRPPQRCASSRHHCRHGVAADASTNPTRPMSAAKTARLPPPADPPLRGGWSGRFAEPVTERVKRFTASVDFDRRLADADIAGSLAHARMLAATGIISARRTSPTIERGLAQIRAEIARGDVRLVARPRGRPPQHREAPDRAGRRRRQAAAHRPLAQRPGRDRPAAVAARRDRRAGRAARRAAPRAARPGRSATPRRSCRASRTCRSRSR